MDINAIALKIVNREIPSVGDAAREYGLTPGQVDDLQYALRPDSVGVPYCVRLNDWRLEMERIEARKESAREAMADDGYYLDG